MLGHYGWLMSLQPIDHPDAERHGGRIYIKSTDIRPGTALLPGQVVECYLYADGNGIGAEDCHLAGDGSPEPVPCQKAAVVSSEVWWSHPTAYQRWRCQAREIAVPAAQPGLVACAGRRPRWTAVALSCPVVRQRPSSRERFVPVVLRQSSLSRVPRAPRRSSSCTSRLLDPGAREFVPASRTPRAVGPLNPSAPAFVPSAGPRLHAEHGRDVLVPNFNGFADSDSDSDEGDSGEAAAKSQPWQALADRCARAIGGAESERAWGGRDRSTARHHVEPVFTVLDSMVSQNSKASKQPSDLSTSAGDSSDSDVAVPPPAPPPGLGICKSGGDSETEACVALPTGPPPGLALVAPPWRRAGRRSRSALPLGVRPPPGLELPPGLA